MRTVLNWIVVIGLIWLAAVGTTTGLIAGDVPDSSGAIRSLNSSLISWGPALGGFIAGPLSLAIILHILISMAEKLGWRTDALTSMSFDPRRLSMGSGVQAVIAVVIIIAFAVSALGNVGQVSALKDIALVVVGFYFGDRKRTGEIQDAANAAAIGVAGSLTAGAAPLSPDAQDQDASKHNA
jgi:hypothetical protein